MSAPQFFNQVARPVLRILGLNNGEQPGELSVTNLARLLTPRGIKEVLTCTMARFAVRLYDRATGEAYSADEVLSESLIQAKAAVDGEVFGTGAPVEYSPATVTLNPAGDDNDIDIESTDPSLLVATIVIDASDDRTSFTATKIGTVLRVKCGDKYRITITPTVGLPYTLIATGQDHTTTGVKLWTSDGSLTYPGSGTWYYLEKSLSGWDITIQTAPDLIVSGPTSNTVTTWPDTATWDAGDTTVTATPATAAQAVVALNELDGITADNAAGNDGSGAIAGRSFVSFNPGTTATPGLPRIRLDDTSVWINTGTVESPAWKEFESVAP
jgi:hypothetical protein